MLAAKWVDRFMDTAQNVSGWSNDGSRQVGAVIAQGKHVISSGYNGQPANIDIIPIDKNHKNSLTIHAECNAILHAKRDLEGCSIFVYGLPPCQHCALLIVQANIRTVYYRLSRPISLRWEYECNAALATFECAGVQVIEVK